MPPPNSDPSEALDTWDDAPCGLLRIDADGLVIAANIRLLDRLGLDRAAVIGRMHWNDLLAVGSRVFFQTQLAPVLELDGALEEVMLDLRGSDGQRIPALVNATRISTATGGPAGARIAVMSVPDRRAYENELRQAREQADRARAADTHARLRLELLAGANTALASSVDVEVALGRLARVLVADLADWCLIYTVDPDQPTGTPSWSAAHRDPARQDELERLAGLLPRHAQPESDLSRVRAGAGPVLLTDVSEEHQRRSTNSPEVLALYDAVGVRSAMIVPSTARGVHTATIILVRGAGRPFTEEDLADLSDLGARTGIVIDNVRRHAREHGNSVALQQALLTSPPATPGAELVTRYLPASTENEVGGDWYDAFLQSDGTPILVIGDVVGHDILAAAAMGQLRGVIRSIGYLRHSTPADILTRTDSTARGLGVAVLASAFVARLVIRSDGATLQWSNAGHPPPLLITRDGSVRTLAATPEPILGIAVPAERHEHAVELFPGDVLLLYTDGLVERTDEDIDESIAQLAGRLGCAQALPLDELCDLVLSGHSGGRRDDIALLAMRFLGADSAP